MSKTQTVCWVKHKTEWRAGKGDLWTFSTKGTCNSTASLKAEWWHQRNKDCCPKEKTELRKTDKSLPQKRAAVQANRWRHWKKNNLRAEKGGGGTAPRSGLQTVGESRTWPQTSWANKFTTARLWAAIEEQTGINMASHAALCIWKEHIALFDEDRNAAIRSLWINTLESCSYHEQHFKTGIEHKRSHTFFFFPNDLPSVTTTTLQYTRLMWNCGKYYWVRGWEGGQGKGWDSRTGLVKSWPLGWWHQSSGLLQLSEPEESRTEC